MMRRAAVLIITQICLCAVVFMILYFAWFAMRQRSQQICSRMSLDNGTEMNTAKCGNEIRHLFLNYKALMGRNKGGGGCTGKLDWKGERRASQPNVGEMEINQKSEKEMIYCGKMEKRRAAGGRRGRAMSVSERSRGNQLLSNGRWLHLLLNVKYISI